MWRTVLIALLTAACPLCASPVRIHGYITAITSSKSFSIDDYRITRDDSLAFELDKGGYPDATFRPEDLRVGTELEVQGDFNDSSHQLHATCIKVFYDDNLRVKRYAVIEHAAVLAHDSDGWTGTIHADGQTIKVDGQTRLVLKDGQTNQLTPGLSIAYEGRRERDGSITASKLEIFPNDTGKNERKLWREITPRLNSDDEISIAGAKYRLTPDAEAQSYIQRIGMKLVPSFYQQDLSGGAVRRLSFQFYLVENPEFNAHAFPNGTVLVNKGVFRVLTSEAQLAAVLGHEIAHTTQEHAVREFQFQKPAFATGLGKRSAAAVKNELMGNSYSPGLENQADRVSLEYLVAAGYDAREAAEVWKQAGRATGESKAFWSAAGKGEDWSLGRRSYLLAELRNSYSGVNFQSFVRDREEFDTLAGRFGNETIAQRPAVPDDSESVRPGNDKPAAEMAQIRRVSSGQGESQDQRYGANAVTIHSDPAGAEVILNGRIIGKTPFTLPTGAVGLPFILTVQKAGYRSWTGQLVSVPGRTNFRVDLLPSR